SCRGKDRSRRRRQTAFQTDRESDVGGRKSHDVDCSTVVGLASGGGECAGSLSNNDEHRTSFRMQHCGSGETSHATMTDCLLATCCCSCPVSPIQRPVLDRLSDVLAFDLLGCVKVGDGAGQFQDAIMGAGAETLLLHGALQHALAVGSQLA